MKVKLKMEIPVHRRLVVLVLAALFAVSCSFDADRAVELTGSYEVDRDAFRRARRGIAQTIKTAYGEDEERGQTIANLALAMIDAQYPETIQLHEDGSVESTMFEYEREEDILRRYEATARQLCFFRDATGGRICYQYRRDSEDLYLKLQCDEENVETTQAEVITEMACAINELLYKKTR